MSEELVEEVDSINAIYEDSTVKVGSNIYEITIPDTSYKMRLSFSSKYPEVPPELLSISGPNSSHDDSRVLKQLKDGIFQVFSPGTVCIFELLELARDIVNREEEPVGAVEAKNKQNIEEINPFLGWHSSEPTVEKKSVFIGHSAAVRSKEEAVEMINRLKHDKRISRAAHNITAWRIVRSNGVIIQDCDDDGENAAGGRLLHLLNVTDSKNVVLVVSRWFGGVLLGPSR